MLAPERALYPDPIATEVLKKCDGKISIQLIGEDLAKKYNIDLWKLAKNDRIFIDHYNTFHKFSDREISEIMEKECKLFEEILDEIKPDFFLTTETAMRPHHLFYLLCKKKGRRKLELWESNNA